MLFLSSVLLQLNPLSYQLQQFNGLEQLNFKRIADLNISIFNRHNKINYFLDTLQFKYNNTYQSSIQPQKYFITSDKVNTYLNVDTGSIIHRKKNNSFKENISFVINDDILYQNEICPYLDDIEEFVRNYFDLWNDKLYGQIMMIPPHPSDNNFSKVGMFHGILNNRLLNFYFYRDEEYAGFVSDDGTPIEFDFFKMPVKNTVISSYYNLERVHPVLKIIRPHLGTDYAGGEDDPVYVVANGVVEEVGRKGANGNIIKVKHSDRYSTQYLHLKSIKNHLKIGSKVTKGQVVGYLGTTGLSTGPHVCFRFWDRGRQINHLETSPGSVRTGHVIDRELFLENKNYYDSELNTLKS